MLSKVGRCKRPNAAAAGGYETADAPGGGCEAVMEPAIEAVAKAASDDLSNLI